MNLSLFLVFLSFFIQECNTLKLPDDNLKNILSLRTRTNQEYESAVLDLINRIVPEHSTDFLVKIDEFLNPSDQLIDTFELETINQNKKLLIKANSGVAAAWGFNYYLKFYCNSTVNWSGKNININDSLPIVEKKIRIQATDYIRFYQNVCTYSYSYVWWDWKRWEYEIDWAALNGINLVYAQTAAEYTLIKVFSDMGFSLKEINQFFTGPAYLAWFRMGNLKSFGGHLTENWHRDQVSLLKLQLERYSQLGIKYVLPAFAGFVPDQITRLYPQNNFTQATDWVNFQCNYSCVLMANPMDALFQKIGRAYVREIIRQFGTTHFYSADIFNEMIPKSNDSTYLAVVSAAVFKSIQSIDEQATWVMQAWAFNDKFWTDDNVQAFLRYIPIGNLLILDLWAEELPHYKRFQSFHGHYFVWNMLHDFGGANGLFGPLDSINSGPELARNFPQSSMIGIGITMEGINQNEFVYEFFLEKAWRKTSNEQELTDFARNFSVRRYTHSNLNKPIGNEFEKIWTSVAHILYNIDDYQNKQLFTKRPSFDLIPEKVVNEDDFLSTWDALIQMAPNYINGSTLFKYDLVDISKEALRILFNRYYMELVDAYNKKDLNLFDKQAKLLKEILTDMDDLLATDSRFLLGNWLESAKEKGVNRQEKELYEWNARNQITIWGTNTTDIVLDYACKAWSGLIKDYYLPRWMLFFKLSEEALAKQVNLNISLFNDNVYNQVEKKFILANEVYSTNEIGDSMLKAKELNEKYRF
jgi:alpha-N-acetylglucosaminidase